MKIAVFIDCQNMYFALQDTRNAKMDYVKLMDYISDLGEIQLASGYGYQQSNEAVPFITALRAIGVTPRFTSDRGSRSVEIACDAMRALYNQDIDLMVLVSSDGALAPLIKHAGHHNVKVLVMAATPSKKFAQAYECLELPESVLRRD